MRAIIDRKVYDTETATEIMELRGSAWTGKLYQAPGGSWFLAGKGDAASPFATRTGPSSMASGSGIRALTEDMASGSGIRALTEDMAYAYVEDQGTLEQLERYFGHLLDDA